jgi:hypothetical protein
VIEVLLSMFILERILYLKPHPYPLLSEEREKKRK